MEKQIKEVIKLRPLSLSFFDPKQEIPFPLYVKKQEKDFEKVKDIDYVSKKYKPISLYYPSNEEENVQLFLEKNLSKILQNQNVNIDEKSKIIYSTSKNLMNNVFKNPKTKENISRGNDIVNNTIHTALEDDSSFRSLVKASSYDYYTFSHSVDVMIYSLGIANKLGYSQELIKKIGQSSLFHDIGKSNIPDEIINKKGKLSDDEFQTIKNHPKFGLDILAELDVKDKLVLDGVISHHEKYDGKGYPKGLVGKELTEFAQIIAIADVFSALSTKRSYKNAFTTFEALKIMKLEMKNHFNPNFLNIFIKLMSECSS